MKETERIGVDLIVECDAYSCPSLSCSSDSKSVRSNEQNVGTQTNTAHELPPEDRAYVEEGNRTLCVSSAHPIRCYRSSFR